MVPGSQAGTRASLASGTQHLARRSRFSMPWTPHTTGDAGRMKTCPVSCPLPHGASAAAEEKAVVSQEPGPRSGPPFQPDALLSSCWSFHLHDVPETAWRKDLPVAGSSDILPRVFVLLGLSAALDTADFPAQPRASPLSPGPRFCHCRHPLSAPCSLISQGDLRDPGAAAIPELGWLPISHSPGQRGWMFARPFHLGSPQLPPTQHF